MNYESAEEDEDQEEEEEEEEEDGDEDEDEDEEMAAADEDEDDGDEDEDEESEEEEDGEEDDEEEEEEEEEETDIEAAATAAAAAAASAAAATAAAEAQEAEQVAAAVAAAQAALQEVLDLPRTCWIGYEWEKQQSSAEGDWRLKQSRMHLEFEAERRLQSSSSASAEAPRVVRRRPTPALRRGSPSARSSSSGSRVNSAGCASTLRAGVPQEMLPLGGDPLDLVRSARPAAPRASAALRRRRPRLEWRDRHARRSPTARIAMPPVADDARRLHALVARADGGQDPAAPPRHQGARPHRRGGRGRHAPPTSASLSCAMRAASSGRSSRRSCRKGSLSPSTTSRSRRRRRAARRAPARWARPLPAEPAAQKQVFADTPVELYTRRSTRDGTTRAVYFSDLRDEVAVDVLNLTGVDVARGRRVRSFPPDATGAALNYKIIVRDGAVIAVLYRGRRRGGVAVVSTGRSPLVRSSRRPCSLGKLGSLPRGLIVAREPRDLPEHVPQWPSRPGLRHKGKHRPSCPAWWTCRWCSRTALLGPHQECSVRVRSHRRRLEPPPRVACHMGLVREQARRAADQLAPEIGLLAPARAERRCGWQRGAAVRAAACRPRKFSPS